jgi:hypothetical protein
MCFSIKRSFLSHHWHNTRRWASRMDEFQWYGHCLLDLHLHHSIRFWSVCRDLFLIFSFLLISRICFRIWQNLLHIYPFPCTYQWSSFGEGVWHGILGATRHGIARFIAWPMSNCIYSWEEFKAEGQPRCARVGAHGSAGLGWQRRASSDAVRGLCITTRGVFGS